MEPVSPCSSSPVLKPADPSSLLLAPGALSILLLVLLSACPRSSHRICCALPPSYRFGYIDLRGNLVIPYRYWRAKEFSEGLAPVAKSDGLWQYIDKKGQTVIPPAYSSAGIFSEGLAGVCTRKPSRCGFIGKDGKPAIPLRFGGKVKKFSSGLAPVSNGSGWGFIDRQGKLVLPFVHDDALGFSQGLAPVKHKELWGYIDRSGKVVIPFRFESAYPFSDGRALVYDKNRYGGSTRGYRYIDKTGKDASSGRYDYARPYRKGLGAVRIDFIWKCLDLSGAVVWTSPRKYMMVQSCDDPLHAARLQGKVGFVDRTGRVAIKPRFDWAWPFSDGMARVGYNMNQRRRR